MRFSGKKTVIALACVALVAACGNRGGNGSTTEQIVSGSNPQAERESTIWDLFERKDTGTVVKVNKYLWAASLEVLNFLPVQTADPFTGVISTGYGNPPGGGRAYRATVHIDDPALDARSLNVALQSRSGPVPEATQRAVEDAILARARQLRIEAGRF